MTVVTANDLKTKGVSSIESLLKTEKEIVVSVRGEPRYVIMDIAQYDHLRECELEAAWLQAQADLAGGRYRRESAEEHIARLSAEIDDEL